MPKGDSGAGTEHNKMITEAREEGIRTGNEYVGIINNLTGQAVGGGLHTSDKPGEAQLSPEMIDAVITSQADSLDIIHNHPINTSFSADDLSFAEFTSVRSITAAAHDGTRYEVVFSGGQRISGNKIEKAWNDEFNRTQDPYASKIVSGELTYESALRQHGHEINQTLAKKYKWVYRRV